MIAVIDTQIQAQNPSAPLFPWKAYQNSPTSLRIRNVPKKIGLWNIDKVSVAVTYPDNTMHTAQAVLTGGVWVATIPACTRSGTVSNGYAIIADGTDENGNAVSGYVLGRGDVYIMDADITVSADIQRYNVSLVDGTGDKSGDLFLSGDTYALVNADGSISALGGNSELPADISAQTVTAGMLSADEAHVEFINFFDGQNGSSIAYQLSQIPYKPIVQHNLGYSSTPQTVTVQPFAVNVIIPHDENNITIDFGGVDFSGGKAIDTIIVVNCAFSMPASFAWTYAFMYMGETNLASGYRNVFTVQQIGGGDMIVRRELY